GRDLRAHYRAAGAVRGREARGAPTGRGTTRAATNTEAGPSQAGASQAGSGAPRATTDPATGRRGLRGAAGHPVHRASAGSARRPQGGWRAGVEDGGPVPLRGIAARIAENMDQSLSVPTATSVRAVPAKLLEDNRIVINNSLARGRGGKVSFTHLIGYAVVR